jgi:hypothetical protein
VMSGVSLTGIVDLPALPNVDYVIGALADADADGDADVYLRNNATGQNAIWVMQGTVLGGIVDLPALPNTSYRMVGPR